MSLINTEIMDQELEMSRMKMEQEIEEFRLKMEASKLEMEHNKKMIEETKKYNIAIKPMLSRMQQAISEEDQFVTNESGVSVKKHRNIVITADTQVGKTKTLLSIIENAPNGTISVVSCDNRGDQLRQLSGRMHNNRINHLLVSEITVGKSGILSPKNFNVMKRIFSEEKRLVFVLLNNNSQCSKLAIIIKTLLNSFKGFSKYQVLHDEADLISKGDIHDHNNADETAKVHKSWISHFNDLTMYPSLRFVKRIWISATPENCSLIHEVTAKDLFILPTPPMYRKQNCYSEWKNQIEMVQKEVTRITISNLK